MSRPSGQPGLPHTSRAQTRPTSMNGFFYEIPITNRLGIQSECVIRARHTCRGDSRAWFSPSAGRLFPTRPLVVINVGAVLRVQLFDGSGRRSWVQFSSYHDRSVLAAEIADDAITLRRWVRETRMWCLAQRIGRHDKTSKVAPSHRWPCCSSALSAGRVDRYSRRSLFLAVLVAVRSQ